MHHGLSWLDPWGTLRSVPVQKGSEGALTGKDSIGEGKEDGANTLDQWLKQSGIIGLEKGSNQGLGTPIVKYLKYSMENDESTYCVETWRAKVVHTCENYSQVDFT